MKTYKEKVLEFIVENVNRFNWVQDKQSNYTDYEAELKSGITLRVVSNWEGKYLQILKSCTDYQCYNGSEYPEVENILDAIIEQETNKKRENFFESVYEKLVEEF